MIKSVESTRSSQLPLFKSNESSGLLGPKFTNFSNASYGGYWNKKNVIDFSGSQGAYPVYKFTSSDPSFGGNVDGGNALIGDSSNEATARDLMLASEQVLAKLWLTDEEDKAWAHLQTLPEVP